MPSVSHSRLSKNNPSPQAWYGLKKNCSHYIYAHAEEYGYDMYQYPDKFPVDTSNYTTSNGLFTVTYDEKFSEDDSAFFSLSIKDFRYWW